MPLPRLLPALFYQLGFEDDGGQICLRVGGRVRVDLEQTPSTGFGWELDKTSAAFLRLEHQAFQPNSPYTIAPGSDGGILSIFFLATAAGEGQLKLVLARPDEDGLDICHSYAVSVNVL
jgi:predicted secreted protein